MGRRIRPDIIGDQDVLTVPPGTTVREAAKRLAARRVGCAVVLEGTRLVGIVTERDVLNRVLAADRDPDRTTVAEVMTRRPTTIAPDGSAIEALRLMSDGGFRHLPVVEEERVVGVVSLRDFLGSEFGELERELTARQTILELR